MRFPLLMLRWETGILPMLAPQMGQENRCILEFEYEGGFMVILVIQQLLFNSAVVKLKTNER